MEGSARIATLFGIPIRIHFTFLLIIPFFAWIIGSQIELTAILLEDIFRPAVPIDTSLITAGLMPYILGVVVALALFAGVLLHELAHSLVAQSKGIQVNSITLMILGGVASMEEATPDPKTELPMALAGPLMSLAIGIVSGIAAYLSLQIPSAPVAGLVFYIFGYLAILNIILFVFNLIPAFPMDGGRVLRAVLARRMPLDRATGIAAEIGRLFAIFFGIVGLFSLNIILILIAVFIYLGAGQEATMIRYNVLLKGVLVRDAMTSPVVTIPHDLPLEEIVALMYSSRHLGFPVIDRGVLEGMVTLADIQSVSSLDREAMQARDVMTKEIISLPPDAPLTEAMKIMSAQNIGRIPVISDGELTGIVTRTDILRVMELKEI